MFDFGIGSFEERASEAEYWQTPLWAILAALRAEMLSPFVVDPCCGDGRMAIAAMEQGCNVFASDLNQWPGDFRPDIVDFLSEEYEHRLRLAGFHENLTFFMNPPFSKACEFVDKAKELGARKIICFQRFAWWEGGMNGTSKRGCWWQNNQPNRIYVYGDRATCWLGHIPEEKRGIPKKRGGAGTGTTTAHGLFVWEKGHPNGVLTGQLYKGN